MAEGLNRVLLLGTVGADPELRFGQSAESGVLRVRLVTNESYFDKRSNERKERADWHNIVVFGKRGEALQKILKKGDRIMIEGRLQTGSYEKDGQKHYRTDVVASNVVLAGGGGPRTERAESPSRERQTARGPAQRDFADHAADSFDSDDIPF